MFKIIPIQDTEEQQRIAALCGAEYKSGHFAYAMLDYDTLEVMGFSQFEILGEVGFITDIKERLGKDDFEAMFILARQTMNFIDTCGAHKCRLGKDAASERLSLAAGFKKSADGYFCDMTGMFDGHCSGHAVNLEKK